MPDDPGEIEDPHVLTVMTELDAYLRAHPNSADTVEGIARWWFAPTLRPTVAQVGAALRWMQALDVVEALYAADGRVRYRLNRRLATGPARPGTH